MRVIIGIGVGFYGNGVAIPPAIAERKIRQAIRETTSDFGGCFVQRGEGGWKNDQGKIVIESGITLQFETDYSVGKVNRHAEYLRDLFGQSCVIVSMLESKTEFVTAEPALIH